MNTLTSHDKAVASREADRRPPIFHRSRTAWFSIRQPIPMRRVLGLGIAVWVLFLGLWELVVLSGWISPLLVPTPTRVMVALYDLIVYHPGLFMRPT